MTHKLLRVALAQQSFTADRDSNLEKNADAISRAAEAGAQLLLLPELHTSLYFCQSEDEKHFDLAEAIPGPTTDFLGQLAAKHNMVIVGSVFERRAAGIYHNTAVVLDSNGELVGQYRKMHIPDDPGFYEKFYFTPGDQGFIPIETSIGVLGVLVCWDQWFPEAARAMALNGAELLLYPTAIGWDPADNKTEKGHQLSSWRLIQRSHAVANGIPVLSCNRSGHEDDPSEQSKGITFWGHSFVAGQQGELISEALTDETLLIADVDLQRSESVRRTWPFFRDRRIDAYGNLLKRFGK
ncbi:MAG: carbon-nitrogen hydrolase [Proteobacteria bacterium]|nr:carbon-nitrogen hydrolase [Pseudomonadota bacterium]